MTPEERRWCERASRYGGSFVKTFAQAVFCADDVNFQLLRPVLHQLMEKYFAYSTGTWGDEEAVNDRT